MVMQYKAPAQGKPSSIGPQINTAYYQRKAMEDAQKEQEVTTIQRLASFNLTTLLN